MILANELYLLKKINLYEEVERCLDIEMAQVGTCAYEEFIGWSPVLNPYFY